MSVEIPAAWLNEFKLWTQNICCPSSPPAPEPLSLRCGQKKANCVTCDAMLPHHAKQADHQKELKSLIIWIIVKKAGQL